MALRLDIASNTRDAVRGVEDIGDALDQVSDSLDDLGRDGAKAGDKLSDSLTDGARDSTRAVDSMERKFSDSMRDMTRDAQTAGKRVGDEMEDGAHRAGESVQSFREEAVQNFSEVASSFQGDASQLADGVQGLTGGLAASMPPLIGIPVAAGGAIVAGVASVVTSALDKMKADTEAAFEDMTESGNNFVSEGFYNQKIKDMLDDPDILKLAQKQSDALKLPVETVIEAMAGLPSAQAQVNAAIDSSNASLQVATDGWTDMSEAQRKQFEANQRTREQMDATNQAVDAATNKAKIYNQTTQDVTGALQGQTDATKKQKDAIDSIPSSKTVELLVKTPDFAKIVRDAQNYIDRNPIRMTVNGKFGRGEI